MMAKHFQHLRSNTVDNGSPKKPTSLLEGEIAVQYNAGNEQLYIENDEGEIVELLNKGGGITNLETVVDGDVLTLTATPSADGKTFTLYANADTYNKADIESKIAEALTNGTIDLDAYLTKTEAENTYQSKGTYVTNVSASGTSPLTLTAATNSTTGAVTLIGSVDLSNYATVSNLEEAIDGKQNKLNYYSESSGSATISTSNITAQGSSYALLKTESNTSYVNVWNSSVDIHSDYNINISSNSTANSGFTVNVTTDKFTYNGDEVATVSNLEEAIDGKQNKLNYYSESSGTATLKTDNIYINATNGAAYYNENEIATIDKIPIGAKDLTEIGFDHSNLIDDTFDDWETNGYCTFLGQNIQGVSAYAIGLTSNAVASTTISIPSSLTTSWFTFSFYSFASGNRTLSIEVSVLDTTVNCIVDGNYTTITDVISVPITSGNVFHTVSFKINDTAIISAGLTLTLSNGQSDAFNVGLVKLEVGKFATTERDAAEIEPIAVGERNLIPNSRFANLDGYQHNDCSIVKTDDLNGWNAVLISNGGDLYSKEMITLTEGLIYKISMWVKGFGSESSFFDIGNLKIYYDNWDEIKSNTNSWQLITVIFECLSGGTIGLDVMPSNTTDCYISMPVLEAIPEINIETTKEERLKENLDNYVFEIAASSSIGNANIAFSNGLNIASSQSNLRYLSNFVSSYNYTDANNTVHKRFLTDKSKIHEDYTFRYYYGIYGGVTNIEITECRYPKVVLTDAFYNAFQMQTFNSCSINVVGSLDTTFNNCSHITSFDDLGNWNTSGVTSMNHTFGDCQNLVSLNFVTNWDFSNVSIASHMFYNCSNLTGYIVVGGNSINDATNMFRRSIIYHNSLEYNNTVASVHIFTTSAHAYNTIFSAMGNNAYNSAWGAYIHNETPNMSLFS